VARSEEAASHERLELHTALFSTALAQHEQALSYAGPVRFDA
jgi:hypothetical protein